MVSFPLPLRLVTYLQDRNRLKDLENQLTVTEGEGLVGRTWRERLRAWGWRVCAAIFKLDTQGFPGGSVVKSLPASAGDTGSVSGRERPHMPRSSWARAPQLLSLCAEPTRPGAQASQQDETSSHTREGLRSRALEKGPCSSRDPAQPKTNRWINEITFK